MPTGTGRKLPVLKGFYGSNRGALAPSTIYYAGYTEAPTDDGGGTEGGYSNYARVAVSNVDASWLYATDRISNATQINFPTPDEDTEDIVAIAIHGHATNDDICHWETLDYPLSALDGKPLYIPVGFVIITIPPQ